MDNRRITALVVGGIGGIVLSLVLFGDDGPGIEARHLLFLVAGVLLGVVIDVSTRRRTR